MDLSKFLQHLPTTMPVMQTSVCKFYPSSPLLTPDKTIVVLQMLPTLLTSQSLLYLAARSAYLKYTSAPATDWSCTLVASGLCRFPTLFSSQNFSHSGHLALWAAQALLLLEQSCALPSALPAANNMSHVLLQVPTDTASSKHPLSGWFLQRLDSSSPALHQSFKMLQSSAIYYFPPLSPYRGETAWGQECDKFSAQCLVHVRNSTTSG